MDTVWLSALEPHFQENTDEVGLKDKMLLKHNCTLRSLPAARPVWRSCSRSAPVFPQSNCLLVCIVAFLPSFVYFSSCDMHAHLNAVHWSLLANCDVALWCFHEASLKSASITGVLHKLWYIRVKALWRNMSLLFCSCSRNEALVALQILCWQRSHSSVLCWSLVYTIRRWRGDVQLQKQLPVKQIFYFLLWI